MKSLNYVKSSRRIVMNVRKTIGNIRATCDNYVDPDMLAFIIDENYYMGTNNIMDLEKYEIENDDSYEERLLKILKYENIFLPVGMITFVPFLNECDIFAQKDYNFKLTQEEFDTYSDEEEKLIGILVKKDSSDYIIGKSEVCSCKVDSSFEELEKTDFEFYKKIEEIITEKIID